MAIPVVTVQAAFGDAPGAASYTWKSIHGLRDVPTNLVANDGFEVDASGWSVVGAGSSIARSTAQQKFGSASGLFTVGANGDRVETTATIVVGQTYALSMWVRGNGTCRLELTDAVVATTLNFTATATWTRQTVTQVAGGTGATVRLWGFTATEVYLDGVQLELQVGVVTSGVVRHLSYQRGRQNEITRMETGTGRLILSDPNSDFDAGNTAGLHYPDVKPMVAVRALATIAGTNYPLFQHFAERWPRTVRVRGTYTEREVSTVDGFEWLARAGLASDVHAEQVTGARITTVLDNIGWSSALRDLDTGQATHAAVTFAAGDTTKALAHLLDIAESENGLLFIDAQGRVAFVERHALVKTPYTVSQVTFRDDLAGGGGYPFVDSLPSFDLDNTFNDWTGTRTGGTPQTASDATSQTDYGLRSDQFTSTVTADGDVLSQAQWKLAQFKDPLNRLESITVMPGDDTAFWEAVLGLEIGDRITVRELPPGFSTVQSKDYVIQRIEAIFPIGPVSGASFTFGLWPAVTTAFWSAGDASNSLAGTSTRAAY